MSAHHITLPARIRPREAGEGDRAKRGGGGRGAERPLLLASLTTSPARGGGKRSA
jgi:hypothetical protein